MLLLCSYAYFIYILSFFIYIKSQKLINKLTTRVFIILNYHNQPRNTEVKPIIYNLIKLQITLISENHSLSELLTCHF